MPTLFHRNKHPVPEVLPDQTGFMEATTLSPYEFIRQNETALVESSKNWADVAQRVVDTQDPSIVAKVTENLSYVFGLNNMVATDETIAVEAARLTKDLGTFQLITARHKSGGGLLDILPRAFDTEVFTFADTNLGYLLRNDKTSSSRMIKSVIVTANEMRAADDVGKDILLNLASQYAGQPDGLMQFVQLYRDGAAEIDPRYNELKEIITSDWLHYDTSKSVLRGYCQNLRANPVHLVQPFVRDVVTAERDKRMVGVQNMARFAVAAATGKDIPLTMQEALIRTYSVWKDFDDIDTLFTEYAGGQIDNLEAAFNDITADANRKSLRIHRSKDEVEQYKKTMFIHYSTSRDERRREVKARARLDLPERRVPTTEQAQLVIAAAEAERQDRTIYTVKQTATGYTTVEAKFEELVTDFKITPEKGLSADVQKMLERISDQPISQASNRLAGNFGRIVVDGKRLNLWRFAPNDSPALKVHPDHRFHRIVYGLMGRALVVVDIMNHDAFTKKYTSS